MSFLGIILIIGIAFGITILLLLIRMNSVHKRYTPLIVYVIISLIELIVQALLESNLEDYVHLLYTTEPFAMLYGILIYLYVRNQSRPSLYLQKSDWLFLIPFVISILTYLPYYFLGADEKIVDFENFGGIQSDVLTNIWEWNFEIVLNSAFLIAALTELKRYNTNIKEQFSDVNRIDLRITRIIIGVGLLSYAVEFIFVFAAYYGVPYFEFLVDTFSVLRIIILLFLGYEAFISYKHINNLHKTWIELPTTEMDIERSTVKYLKSTLSDDVMEDMKDKLLAYMSEKEPFLDSKLRIKVLSELIDIPSHQLSQVINKTFNQNFYEFVNGYRVEKAKKLLKDPEFKQFTYVAIGFEVGFNSKSAFYTAFKKNTGTTPAKF